MNNNQAGKPLKKYKEKYFGDNLKAAGVGGLAGTALGAYSAYSHNKKHEKHVADQKARGEKVDKDHPLGRRASFAGRTLTGALGGTLTGASGSSMFTHAIDRYKHNKDMELHSPDTAYSKSRLFGKSLKDMKKRTAKNIMNNVTVDAKVKSKDHVKMAGGAINLAGAVTGSALRAWRSKRSVERHNKRLLKIHQELKTEKNPIKRASLSSERDRSPGHLSALPRMVTAGAFGAAGGYTLADAVTKAVHYGKNSSYKAGPEKPKPKKTRTVNVKGRTLPFRRITG